MRRFFGLFLLFIAAHAHAFAEPAPIIAPAPEWVEEIDPAERDPDRADRPVQMLLLDWQSYYGTEHHDHYLRMVALVQNQQGLQGFGNIVLPWQPDQSDLIVHQARILRGSTSVDLLADGREFTVLRRENNLESALLDGIRTAVMQADGLMVGDVLDVAYTVRRRAGALPLRGENLFALNPGMVMERYRVRQVWPAGAEMRWRATDLLEQTRTRRTRLGTELLLDMEDVEGPTPPTGAPSRFAVPATLQVTQYRGWEEVSTLLAPHYGRASELPADSPLRARIDRIAADHADPRARALAALRLVQDEIRYFALVMGDGNYLPASAEETWARRYGDCKAKTVTLLALLRELGIEAEPVLVNTQLTDGLDERLPQMGLFNHVIVRARIDGRSYWLDGTRIGDRNLDDLASSTLGWGLPIRPSGATLEALPFQPPTRPLMRGVITYDASAGLEEPTPFTAEVTFRGDLATMMRIAASQAGREQFLQQLRENGANLGEEEEIISADMRENEQAGTFTTILTGRVRMRWRSRPGTGSQQFRFDNSTIDWNADFERPGGPYKDAPFALAAPGFTEMVETIILPREGRGFATEGESFERVIAGTRLSRDVRLRDGRAISTTRFQHVAREVPAREALASVDALREITDAPAYLVAPPGLPIGTASAEADAPASSRSAAELLDSGHSKMGAGEVEAALADFDAAIALAPDWGRAHANRGVALVHLDRLEEAGAALADAMRRDQADFVVHQGYGILHLVRGDSEDAIRSLTRSLELDPGNSFTRGARADAFLQLGRIDEALADIDAILSAEPGHGGALFSRARIHAWRGDAPETIAALDAMAAQGPSSPQQFSLRSQMLRRVGEVAQAQSAFAEAKATLDPWLAESELEPRLAAIVRAQLLSTGGEIQSAVEALSEAIAQRPDDSQLLNERCWIRATGNIQLDEALADCDRALAVEERPAALDSRALVKLRLGRIEEAIADADAALALEPRLAASLYVRGIARLRNGDREAGERDLAAARRISFDIDAEYREYGVTPEAFSGDAAPSDGGEDAAGT